MFKVVAFPQTKAPCPGEPFFGVKILEKKITPLQGYPCSSQTQQENCAQNLVFRLQGQRIAGAEEHLHPEPNLPSRKAKITFGESLLRKCYLLTVFLDFQGDKVWSHLRGILKHDVSCRSLC